jgi:DNA polymerase-4
MSTLTRSATLPYATADAATLIAMARRLLLDPLEVGPIRLVGVGFSGLSDVRQESLFPDLELMAEEVSHAQPPPALTDTAATAAAWRIGDDVVHTEHGHGWIQGAGHGVMTIRFETRSSGPGPVHTFPDDTPGIERANAVDSLDWPDYINELAARSREAGDIAARSREAGDMSARSREAGDIAARSREAGDIAARSREAGDIGRESAPAGDDVLDG